MKLAPSHLTLDVKKLQNIFWDGAYSISITWMQKIMKHQKNKYSKNKNLLRLFTLFAFIFPVWGTSPEIQFSASTQYPRISFLDEDPSLQWRTNLSYRQSLGRFASISSLFEYGPKIHQHLNPFRLYSFISEVKTDHFRFQLGRIPYWSPALLTRIDGLSFRDRKSVV